MGKILETEKALNYTSECLQITRSDFVMYLTRKPTMVCGIVNSSTVIKILLSILLWKMLTFFIN